MCARTKKQGRLFHWVTFDNKNQILCNLCFEASGNPLSCCFFRSSHLEILCASQLLFSSFIGFEQARDIKQKLSHVQINLENPVLCVVKKRWPESLDACALFQRQILVKNGCNQKNINRIELFFLRRYNRIKQDE